MALSENKVKELKSKLNALPDTLDFRDKMFESTLVNVPSKLPLSIYQKTKPIILDQKNDGACTGFGLATVANYLRRTCKDKPKGCKQVSQWMAYEMARRYDEWVEEDYSGSSARGAMKGWHKHGICSLELWKSKSATPKGSSDLLDIKRRENALQCQLGTYFRVNPHDLVAMHCAIAEVGILYATSEMHEGWGDVGLDGKIPFYKDKKLIGLHAFAVVGYDHDGFWIQNSWGDKWGDGGFGHITYDDWLLNSSDVWVARLGVPVHLNDMDAQVISINKFAGKSAPGTTVELRPHIVSIGNDGLLKSGGVFGTTVEAIRDIFKKEFKDITAGWKKKRILLYAHGGLTDEKTATEKLAKFRKTLLKAEVYPLTFIWRTDLWSTVNNIVEDAFSKRKPEGFFDAFTDFMIERQDDAIELLARNLTGKTIWEEMKENAVLSSTKKAGGARLVMQELRDLVQRENVEIHIAGHSAGSIFHTPIIKELTRPSNGYSPLKIKTLTFWAPAVKLEYFMSDCAPSIASGQVEDFANFILKDQVEKDDNCGGVYQKSLLYLVSNAFESWPRIPVLRDGVPLLGMQKFVNPIEPPNIESGKATKELIQQWGEFYRKNKAKVRIITSPNDSEVGSNTASRSRAHGDFDDDDATLKALLARILGKKNVNDPD